ncbi:DUF4157 domain-containing protein [Streptomyces coerulescens]|uniref:DUF4157 domain-containing protein n=1 Tax=Streptomyces coerulescens TaxID=29304 RepID=A0ABW0CX89_STRCD
MNAAADAERRAESAAPAARVRTARDVPAASAAGGGPVPEEPVRHTALGDLAVRAKAVVGAGGHPLEREADRAANRVLRLPVPADTGPGRRAIDGPPVLRPATAVKDTAADAAAPETASAAREAETEGDTRATGDGGRAVPAGVQALLDASRGRPLPTETLAYFESAFRHDFSAVLIHDDEAAHAAATALGALAFTRGNDIYLSAGSHAPTSAAGRRLLAHELAHVIQHGSGIRLKPGPKAATKTATTAAKGRVSTSGKRQVEFFSLPVPKFKKNALVKLLGKDHTLTMKKWDGSERTDTQGEAWKKLVTTPVHTAVSQRLKALARPPGETGPVHYLRHKASSSPLYLIGTEADIAERLVRPPWDKDGRPKSFDIDHKLELQLGGTDTTPEKNLWLLESSANRDAGRSIAFAIRNTLQEVLDESAQYLKEKPPSYRKVRQSYDVVVQVGHLVPTRGGQGEPNVFWEADEMTAAELTKPLERVPAKTAKQLAGTDGELMIFSTKSGGAVHRVKPGTQENWKKKGIFEVRTVRWDPAGAHTGATGQEVGLVTGTALEGNGVTSEGEFKFPLRGIQGVGYGGYVDTGRYRLVAKMFSPVEMDSLDFDVVNGFVGRGRILPNLPLLAGKADIGIVMDERGVGVSALLTSDSFNLPGPFRVTGGHILLAAQYPAGLSATGRLNFELEKLAKGWFEATLETGRPFGVSGELDFDSDLFTRARLGVGYRDGKWAVTGELGIGEGKVTGIKQAAAKVAVDGEKILASGTFESSLRGLQGGRLGFAYDPTTGTTIEGELTLGRLPGISGGVVKAKVAQRKDGRGWSVAGEITAQPAIPGVTGSVTGRYDDGAFLAEAALGYQRGLLSGQLRLGLTNQPVGPDGRPAGPPQPNLLSVHGGGELSLKLTPWLIGTARVVVRPNGTIAVAGRIGLPDAFELFARRELNRRLFSLGIDIPIVGVAVAGQRIGIFATIRGGLDLVAGIGPGQLHGTGLEIRYDPDREDATQVEGDTRLLIPADAGLRLFVQGGIGAGIPIVSATAGIELAGQLGLSGQLTAGVRLLWTRSRGLLLDAEAALRVQPTFRFTADAFVLVTADLVISTVELYQKRWNLAAFDYGSNLAFGVVLPLHAEAGRIDFSFDRMRFEYPSIDPAELARGVLRRVIDG